MSTDDKYFQFPISLLRGSLPRREPWASSRDLCQAITHVAVKCVADGADVSLDEEQAEMMAVRYCENRNIDCPEEHNVSMVAAAEYLGVTLPAIQIDQACEQLRMSACRYAVKGTQCRLRCDILWSMHSDEWPLLKSRFLIAVYAGIGQNRSHWLTRSRLATLAMGYSGKHEWTQAGSPTLPTERQCRYWVEQLWM